MSTLLSSVLILYIKFYVYYFMFIIWCLLFYVYYFMFIIQDIKISCIIISVFSSVQDIMLPPITPQMNELRSEQLWFKVIKRILFLCHDLCCQVLQNTRMKIRSNTLAFFWANNIPQYSIVQALLGLKENRFGEINYK